jgi:hypothetical protein
VLSCHHNQTDVTLHSSAILMCYLEFHNRIIMLSWNSDLCHMEHLHTNLIKLKANRVNFLSFMDARTLIWGVVGSPLNRLPKNFPWEQRPAEYTDVLFLTPLVRGVILLFENRSCKLILQICAHKRHYSKCKSTCWGTVKQHYSFLWIRVDDLNYNFSFRSLFWACVPKSQNTLQSSPLHYKTAWRQFYCLEPTLMFKAYCDSSMEQFSCTETT